MDQKRNRPWALEPRYVTAGTRADLLRRAKKVCPQSRGQFQLLRLFGHVMLSRERWDRSGVRFGLDVVDAVYARPGRSKAATANGLANVLQTAFGVRLRLGRWTMPQNGKPGKRRRAWVKHVPEDILRLLEDDLRSDDPLVELVTGAPIDRAGIERRLLAEAGDRTNPDAWPEVSRVVERLNGLPIEEFTPILRGIPDALVELAQIKKARGRANAFATLNAVRAFPKPVYFAAHGSDRAFPVGAAFHYLPKKVRKCLTSAHPEWEEYDQDKCQLRILSSESVCDLPAVGEAIAAGDLWHKVNGAAGLEGDDRSAKEAVYGATYGSSLRQVGHRLLVESLRQLQSEAGGDRVEWGDIPRESFEMVERLLGGPLMTALFDASERRIEALAAGETMRDAFGVERGIDLSPMPGKRRLGKSVAEKRARQLFARIVQSYEARCMVAAGDLMTAWLHDGAWCRKADLAEMKWRVESEARRLGIEVGDDQSPVTTPASRRSYPGSRSGHGTHESGEPAPGRSLNPYVSCPDRKLGIREGLRAWGGDRLALIAHGRTGLAHVSDVHRNRWLVIPHAELALAASALGAPTRGPS